MMSYFKFLIAVVGHVCVFLTVQQHVEPKITTVQHVEGFWGAIPTEITVTYIKKEIKFQIHYIILTTFVYRKLH